MNDLTDLNWLHPGVKIRLIANHLAFFEINPNAQVGDEFVVTSVEPHPFWEGWYGVTLRGANSLYVYALRDSGDERFSLRPLCKPVADYPLLWEPVDE